MAGSAQPPLFPLGFSPSHLQGIHCKGGQEEGVGVGGGELPRGNKAEGPPRSLAGSAPFPSKSRS